MRDVVEPQGVDLEAFSPEDKRQAAADLRRLQNYLRSRTWKATARVLDDLRRALTSRLGDIGLTTDDRAMLHGRLCQVVELIDSLPQLVLEAEQPQTVVPEAEPDDDPARGIGIPELM